MLLNDTRHDNNLKVVHARASCKRQVLWTLNGEQNMKDTMKLEWKRHTPETANRKVTHAVNPKATNAVKTTWRRHTPWKQVEGNTRRENNL